MNSNFNALAFVDKDHLFIKYKSIKITLGFNIII